jgi:hypothetical protein
LKVSLILGPILLVVGGLHFFGEGLGQRFTRFSMGKEYELISREHYNIYILRNRLSEGNLYADILQQYYNEFLKQFEKPFHLSPYQEKIDVLLFNTREEFQDSNVQTLRQELTYTAGHYVPNRRTITLYLNQPEAFQTLIHEHVHAILDFSLNQSIPPSFSRCINEGLACFFENAAFLDDKGNFELFTFDKPPSPAKVMLLKQSIQRGEWINLSTLVSSESQGVVNTLQFYSQSELLVYYLWHMKRDSLFKWFEIELGPRPMDYADFQVVFEDVEAFEKEWKEFILNLP